MTVQDLINALNKIEDKTLLVRVQEYKPDCDDCGGVNYWLDKNLVSVEEHNRGSSGYELNGEVLLVGYE
tara:strand:- start:1005 stop:1211 length:207 start_codon:yes stop_codon:yes gene_type:complete